MKNLVQRLAVGAYGLAQRLNAPEWPLYERCFVPLYFGYKKYFEDPFERLSLEYPELFMDGHILDVGANIGYTALLFSTSLSSGYRVYAFEPETVNYRLLENQIERRGLKEKIVPVHAAVGATDGQVDLWLNPTHPADHRILTDAFQKSTEAEGKKQSVPMRSIDRFMQTLSSPKVSFIKVDVQGYEEDVCVGMVETLAKNPQAIVALEYSPEWMKKLGFRPVQVLEFFKERKYRYYALSRERGLEESTPEKANAASQENGYVDLVFAQHSLL